MDAILYALRNPEVQVAVVTPTFGDIRRVAFGGVSGILSCLPIECLKTGRGVGYNTSNSEIKLHNGSKITGFSATEPDRLRGVQFHRAWCDELAAWQYPDAFDQLMFGLRLGKNPQCVITTTPRPTPLIKDLMRRDNTIVTTGNTFENEENLAKSALDQMREKYGGTRLGRQELYAEILEDVEGALWDQAMIDGCRMSSKQLPDFTSVIVAIDPAVTSHENSDETGIVVVGKDNNNQYYVIDDLSGRYSPDAWGNKAISAFEEYKADRIVAEVNNGGDLVERLLRNIDSQIPYRSVRASRGKIARAEPVSALYEQGRVRHIKIFSELENQMCTYTGQSKPSPDRLDALVWGLSEISKSQGSVNWRIS
tara:strand:- start:12809 stop:13909 length:1101 start_codon:yes stop_codon:yes gene_type:complete